MRLKWGLNGAKMGLLYKGNGRGTWCEGEGGRMEGTSRVCRVNRGEIEAIIRPFVDEAADFVFDRCGGPGSLSNRREWG